jgi:hypothetical protein
MLPPVYASVGSEGQPLIAPSASMPSVERPAPHEYMCPRGMVPAEHALVGSEVADVVARPDAHLGLVGSGP